MSLLPKSKLKAFILQKYVFSTAITMGAIFGQIGPSFGQASTLNSKLGTVPDTPASEASAPRYFKCWAAAKNGETAWWSSSDQVISDQGGSFFVGKGNLYRVSLKQVVYGNQKQVPVLKLGVHNGTETKTISYSWVAPGGDRIGINLGPVQAGCSLLTQDEVALHVQEVKSHLLGIMDSSVQSIESPEYFDVTIKHCEVTLKDPENLGTGVEKGSEFLLILQSISTAEAPYRVRVAKLSPSLAQGGVASSNYLVRENLDVTKMCALPRGGRVLNASDLVLNKCTTYLRKAGSQFIGGTLPEGCPSEIRGAVRVSNEVTLTSHTMNSWDRGWKADGTQAWGAVQGPYRFRKTKVQDALLSQLAGFMSGKFNNSEQVAADSETYTPVSYQICQIDALQKMRPKVRLLLAKQSISGNAGAVVRSRIYKLERNEEGLFVITANKFDESKIATDTCDKNQFERMRTDLSSVQWDTTCPIVFSYDSEKKSYLGSTPAEGCPSTFRGSVKFTSEEEIADGMIAPWERWYDASGALVAGSAKGPYVYKRTK